MNKPTWRDLIGKRLLRVGTLGECVVENEFGSFEADAAPWGTIFAFEDDEPGYELWAQMSANEDERVDLSVTRVKAVSWNIASFNPKT